MHVQQNIKTLMNVHIDIIHTNDMIIYTCVIELCMKAILTIGTICLNAASTYVLCKRYTHKYFTLRKATKAHKGCIKIALLFL